MARFDEEISELGRKMNDRGTVIVYEPKIKDRKWETSPDWTVISRHTPAIERILLEIQREIDFGA